MAKPPHPFLGGTTGPWHCDSGSQTLPEIVSSLLAAKIQASVTESETGGLSRSNSTVYDDLNRTLIRTQDQTQLTATTYYDPLGRPRLEVDPAGSKVESAYRVATGFTYQLLSNAYTSTGDATMGWTLNMRDAMGRIVSTQTYKGADPPAPWGTNTTLTGTVSTAHNVAAAGCAGPATDVTDQDGKTRRYCSDGLGRLKSVTDPNSVMTQYTYDLLDDLTRVSLGGRVRGFEYSSLGRLTKACNPESATADCSQAPLDDTGLDRYTYDPNGNLLTKTDARHIVTTHTGYDALNRPATKAYSDGTPTVAYVYDQGAKGVLSGVNISVDGVTYGTSYTYDGFGRVKTSTQTTAGANPYVFRYDYSLADQLTQVEYPSGRKVKYVPDSAGRIQQVQDGATGTNYATIAYTAPGGISTLALGNRITEQLSWNDRSQLTGMTAVSQSGGSVLALGFYPCTGLATECATGNTGSIRAQTIAAPGLSLTQTYTYDPLNRLATAGEGSGRWSHTYGYDNQGNRWLEAYSNYTAGSFTPTGAGNFNARNRLVIPDLIRDDDYDGAGNQKTAGGYGFNYDADGRLVSTTLNDATEKYVYDGRGQRVMKQTLNGQTVIRTTVYVYDASGNLAAEYTTPSPASPCGTPTCYVSVDHLDSTRLVTDVEGNVKKRYDYYPFGEEIAAGTSGRTTQMGYQAAQDGFNPKFTGQGRDILPDGTPTGLDYFNARYYSPEQGRFVSADPGNAGAQPVEPQTWNAYSYVSNNPELYIDPSGQGFWSTLLSGGLLVASKFFPPLAPIAAIVAGGGLAGDVLFPDSTVHIGQRPNIADLGKCGGPLGNCASLGAAPWSEQSQISPGVQDPKRFILGAQPVDANAWVRGYFERMWMYFWEVVRRPDFVGVNVNAGGVVGYSFTLSVDRYGRLYWSPVGAGVGKSLTTTVSGSCTVNWMHEWWTPSRDQLESFQKGWAGSLTAGFGVGINVSQSSSGDRASGFGAVSPQLGISGNYSFKAPR